MEKEEVKLFTDIFEDKSFPDRLKRRRFLNFFSKYIRRFLNFFSKYKIYAYSLLLGCVIVFFLEMS